MLTALILTTLFGSVALNQGIDYMQHQRVALSQQLATQSQMITDLRVDNAKLMERQRQGAITSIDGVPVANLASPSALTAPAATQSISTHAMPYRMSPYASIN